MEIVYFYKKLISESDRSGSYFFLTGSNRSLYILRSLYYLNTHIFTVQTSINTHAVIGEKILFAYGPFIGEKQEGKSNTNYHSINCNLFASFS
jgi:hypothetical protein